MEVKLDSLLEKIKKDGIEEAEREKEKIIAEAKANANSIIEKAKKEAEKIIENANTESEKLYKNAESSIKQAARDTILSTREKIMELFGKTLQREISSSLKPDLISSIIIKIVESWVKDQSIDVIVSQDEAKKIRDLVTLKIKKDLKNTVTIKPDPTITAGFKIGIKGENLYYDFTDETLAEILKNYLTPTVRELLEK